MDGTASDIIKLGLGGGGGVQFVLTCPTNIFSNVLKTKQTPDSWHEAKMAILFKKGDPKDINNYRPISLLSHSYKIFTRLSQTRIKRTPGENQPREQAGSKRLFYIRPSASSKPVKGPAHAATFAHCNPQYRACNNRRPPCSKPTGLAGGLQGEGENFYPCKKVAVL